MSTKLNLNTQTDPIEFDNKVSQTISSGTSTKNTIATFTEFDINSGHDHDGVNSKKISWDNIDSRPTQFTPTPHDHNSHTNIGPDDHHNHLSAGYDIIPNSVRVSSEIAIPAGAKMTFSDDIKLEIVNDILTISSTQNKSILFDSTISKFYIQSPEIYIGSTTSSINFSTSQLEGQSWKIDGNGRAEFETINSVIISPETENNNITGVNRFNGVKLEATGTFSGLIVGNNNYAINHNTHAQNTDTGTTSSLFRINMNAAERITISTNSYNEPPLNESAVFNDISDIRALVIAGNASRDGIKKRVKIYEELEVTGNIVNQGNIITQGNQPVATYHPDGTIKDNSSSGYIQIGYVLIQWGISSGNNWRTINFPKAFASNSTPSISGGAVDDSEAIFKTRNVTNSQFELNGVDNSGNNINCNLSWIAIGRV